MILPGRGLLMPFDEPSIVHPMIDPVRTPLVRGTRGNRRCRNDRGAGRREWEDWMKRSAIVACLALSVSGLSGCNRSVDCSGGSYRGDCLPGTAGPAITSPAPVGAAAVSPAAPPVSLPPAAAVRGDPRDFADVDDKQCRSYGLRFGSRDYADCRIRLSAQHRGLDPNVGVTRP
jgi:hypothetical protein